MAMIYDPETGDYYDDSAAVYQVQTPSFDWSGLFSKAGDAAMAIGQKYATSAIEKAKASAIGTNPQAVAVRPTTIPSASSFTMPSPTVLLIIAAVGVGIFMLSKGRR